jgi:dihydroxyacetone synthase
MPNMNLIRPADAEECMGMWTLALDEESKDTPSIFTLSRQPVPLLAGTDRTKVKLGAYVIHGAEHAKPDITIIATGAEVYRAIETAELLGKTRKIRVVSMPSQRHFDLQSAEYKRETLRTSDSLVVAIEAWAAYGWAKYAHASVSMHTFVSILASDGLY